MPIVDEDLTKEFTGKKIDLDKMKEDGWSDQGGKNHHFGFPQKKGLWIKQIQADSPCGHYTIWLFVLVHLGRGNVLTQVEEAVHMVHNDGSYDDMGVGFFPPDVETARGEIRNILQAPR